MECLQYSRMPVGLFEFFSFKPCYKWNAFNTLVVEFVNGVKNFVLNLVISGMPSILKEVS